MTWNHYIKAFRIYLQLERGFSPNTINAYIHDVTLLAEHSDISNPIEVSQQLIENFIYTLTSKEASTQARILTGIKAFFNYLCIDEKLEVNPARYIEAPKLPFKLPNVLSYQEIKSLFDSIDAMDPFGIRDRAILELLYACGLRVSECATLEISRLYADLDCIKVIGKGNKERIIPIASSAMYYITLYLSMRSQFIIDKKFEHLVFINKAGEAMTGSSLFNIVMKYSKLANIQKRISPHTFRHSFATHLIEGGASITAVQKMLGHESITSTELYTHLDMRYLRSTIEKYHPRNTI